MPTSEGPIQPTLAEFQRQKSQLLGAEARAEEWERKCQNETALRRLAHAEIRSMCSDRVGADARIFSHQKDYEEKAKECEELRKTNKKLNAELGESRAEHGKGKELKGDNAKLAQECEELKETKEKMAQQYDKLKQINQELKANLDDLREKDNQELKRTKERLMAEVYEVRKELAQREESKRTKEKLKVGLDEARGKLEGKVAQIQEHLAKAELLHQASQELRRAYEKVEGTNKELNADLTEVRGKLAEKDAQIKHQMQRREGACNDYAELWRVYQNLKEANKKLHAELDGVRGKLAEAEELHTGESLQLLEHIDKLESAAKQTSPAHELPKDDEASAAGDDPPSPTEYMHDPAFALASPNSQPRRPPVAVKEVVDDEQSSGNPSGKVSLPLRSHDAPLLSVPHISPFPNSDERAQAAHDHEQKQISITDEEKQTNQLLFPNVPNQSPSNVKADPSIVNDQQPHPRINDEQGLVSNNSEERHYAYATDKRAQGSFKNEQEHSSSEEDETSIHNQEETSLNDEQAQSPNGGQPEQTFSRDGQDIDDGRDQITTAEEQTQASFDQEQAQASKADKVEKCHIDNEKRRDYPAKGQREPAPSDNAQEVPVSDEQEETPTEDGQGHFLDVISQREVALDENQAYTPADDAQQRVPVEYKQEHASNVVAEEKAPIDDDREHVPGDGAQEEIPLNVVGTDTQENVSIHDKQEHASGDDLQEDMSVKDEQDYVPIDASYNRTKDEVPAEDNHGRSSGYGAQEDTSTEVEQEYPPGDEAVFLDDKRHKDFIDGEQRQILMYKEQAQPSSNHENQETLINDEERQTLSTDKRQQTRANYQEQSSTINEQVLAAINDDRRPISTNEDQVQPHANQQNLIEHEQQQPLNSDQPQRTCTNDKQQEHSTSDKQVQDPFNKRPNKQARSKLEYQPVMALLTHKEQQVPSSNEIPQPSTNTGRSLRDVTREINQYLGWIIHDLCTLSADRGLLMSYGRDIIHDLTGLGPDILWLQEECTRLDDNYRILNEQSSSKPVTIYRLLDHLKYGTGTYPDRNWYPDFTSENCYEAAKQRIDMLQASIAGLEVILEELKN
ncbi:MAG: hypothetical protein Q9197_006387, partial [Variospora fuerteventurae]